MDVEADTKPSEESLLKAMEMAWKDHHHARDQTWKTVQMVAVLAAGLLTVDLQYRTIFATLPSAILVGIAAIVGIGITWNHRKLERRKFIHLKNCEELLGLHRDDVIPLRGGDGWEVGKSKEVIDGAVSVPNLYSIWDIFRIITKHNTSLFILRTHIAIFLFALVVVIMRAGLTYGPK